jgi:hypothetical protein
MPVDQGDVLLTALGGDPTAAPQAPLDPRLRGAAPAPGEGGVATLRNPATQTAQPRAGVPSGALAGALAPPGYLTGG